METQSCIVLLSGGYDSVAALDIALERYHALCLFMNWNQPYLEQERRAVAYVQSGYQGKAGFLGVRELSVPVSLCSVPVPEYAPLRNLVFCAVAANVAQSMGARAVISGSKTITLRGDDPYSFRDSCVAFYSRLQNVVHFATEKGLPAIRFLTPVAGWTKARILRRVRESGFDLERLWNCYKNGDQPCGECYHCKEIQKALGVAEGFVA